MEEQEEKQKEPVILTEEEFNNRIKNQVQHLKYVTARCKYLQVKIEEIESAHRIEIDLLNNKIAQRNDQIEKSVRKFKIFCDGLFGFMSFIFPVICYVFIFMFIFMAVQIFVDWHHSIIK